MQRADQAHGDFHGADKGLDIADQPARVETGLLDFGEPCAGLFADEGQTLLASLLGVQTAGRHLGQGQLVVAHLGTAVVLHLQLVVELPAVPGRARVLAAFG